jgi:hypothetical protein
MLISDLRSAGKQGTKKFEGTNQAGGTEVANQNGGIFSPGAAKGMLDTTYESLSIIINLLKDTS